MKRALLALWMGIGLTPTHHFSALAGTDYKIYKPDFSPFEAKAKAWQEWEALGKKGRTTGYTKEILDKKLKLVKPILDANPKWADGHWLYASTLMQIGETQSAQDKASLKRTRAQLAEARDYSKKCLNLQPDLAVCKFFYASAIAKIGTIDGVMASLGKGKLVLNTWLEVYDSDQEYIFKDGYSLQGIVRYALGIFYRVVPDFFLLRWFFGFSGDIDKAVAMHRESLGFTGADGACSKMMLAVAMLCKSEGDKKDKLTGEAFSLLDEIAATPKTEDQSAMVCINDAPRVKKKPGDACGYTKAQVQSRDEETMKAQMKKNNDS
ncbi:hypothetical protein [Pseudobacteriovorax antillogorgiicola]|uniref:Tetratricopeptide repeat protein n=1 Tax=Pseudobacteriovorax antillogorgiicola TaxID=1513793 RepID=A0A1Y6CMU7_9BACT|nr:hypothetical protein [Pseudobacteriovorax antillogorgiicola]TCS44626.1 hypothetical protein EDD56_13259 [Pseudobacteriovorax antillogorgiicola]SMF78417.1 hypothetical protein SAMN06296036_13259 [Pseudobacteriovorax antillogorgiicola]